MPGFRQSTGFARGPGFASDYSPPTWGFRRPSSVTPAIANNAALSVGSVGSVGPITTVTAVVPAAVGDLLVLGIRLGNATATVLTVTGGGVTTWTVNATVADVTPGISTCICYGVVTSVASSSLVITTSATVNTSIALLEFSKTAGTWAADGPQGSAADAGTFPTLVPSASAEMYIGFIAAGTSAITASSATAGYTQVNSGFSAMIYNVSVTGPQTPSVTATNHTGAVAQLIAA